MLLNEFVASKLAPTHPKAAKLVAQPYWLLPDAPKENHSH